MRGAFKWLALLLALMGGHKVGAQGMTTQTTPMYSNYFSFAWEISFPKDQSFLSKTSLSGGRFEYRHFLSKSLSVGGAISWNSFDQHFTSQTYTSTDGNQAVTTDMIRQIYTVPMTVDAQYYFQSGGMLKPYVGLGMGAEYAEQNIYFNVYQLNVNNWGFVVRPEAGLLIQFNQGFYGQLSGSYNYSTNKNDFFRVNSLKQWGIDIGVGFAY